MNMRTDKHGKSWRIQHTGKIDMYMNTMHSLMVHDFKIAIKLSWTGSHLQKSEFAQNVRIGSLFYQVRPLWA